MSYQSQALPNRNENNNTRLYPVSVRNRKAYTEAQLQKELIEEEIQQKKMYYCLANKQSDLGLSWNLRFIMINPFTLQFGFLNIKQAMTSGKPPFLEKKNIPKYKKKGPIATISSFKDTQKKDKQNNQWKLSITVQSTDTKIPKKKQDWLFKFTNKQIVQKLKTIISDVRNGGTLKVQRPQKNIIIQSNYINNNNYQQQINQIKNNQQKNEFLNPLKTKSIKKQQISSKNQVKNTSQKNKLSNPLKTKSIKKQQQIPLSNQNKSNQRKSNNFQKNNSLMLQSLKQPILENQPKQKKSQILNSNYIKYDKQQQKIQSFNNKLVVDKQSSKIYKQQTSNVYQPLANSQKIQSQSNQIKNQSNSQIYSQKLPAHSKIALTNNNKQMQQSLKKNQTAKNIKHNTISKDNSNAINSNIIQRNSASIQASNTIKKKNSNVSKNKIQNNQTDWNALFYDTYLNNIHDSYEIILEFNHYSKKIISELIDKQLYTPQQQQFYQKQKQFNLEKKYESDKLIVYQSQNALVQLYFQNQQEQIQNNNQNLQQNIEQYVIRTWSIAKKQFHNYQFILKKILNQQSNAFLRIPLTCLIQYKGISCFIKAKVMNVQNQINFNEFYNNDAQLINQLQQIIGIRKQSLLKTKQRIIRITLDDRYYIDNLINFLPEENYINKQVSYQLRGQILDILKTQKPNIKWHGGSTLTSPGLSKQQKKQIKQLSQIYLKFYSDFITFLENMQIKIVSTNDLKRQMHINGISMKSLGQMYKLTKNVYVKRLLLSQMAAKITIKIFKKNLQYQIKNLNIIKNLKTKKKPQNNGLEQYVIDFMINLFSSLDSNSKIWQNINAGIKLLYNINTSIQKLTDQLSLGYFLSSFFIKSQLDLDFTKFLRQKQGFFKSKKHIEKILSNKFIKGFKLNVRGYQIQKINRILPSGYQQIINVLNQSSSINGFNFIIQKLNLQQQKIPSFSKNLEKRIKLYLSKYLNPKDLNHLQIYNNLQLNQQPPSLNSLLLYLSLFQHDPSSPSNQKFQSLLNFWCGQFHPLICNYLDQQSKLYLANGDYAQATNLAKNSLLNSIKLSGGKSLLSAQKFIKLADIYFEWQDVEQSLNNYLKAKGIYEQKNRQKSDSNLQIQESIEANYWLGKIFLRISQLNITLNKYSDSKKFAMQCLSLLQNTSCNFSPSLSQQTIQQLVIQSYQTLLRLYELNPSKQDFYNLFTGLGSKLLFSFSKSNNYILRLTKICTISLFNSLFIAKNTQDQQFMGSVIRDIIRIFNEYPEMFNKKTQQQQQQQQHQQESNKQQENYRLLQKTQQQLDKKYSPSQSLIMIMWKRLNQISNILKNITKNKLIENSSYNSKKQYQKQYQFIQILSSLTKIIGINFMKNLLRQMTLNLQL